LAETEVMDLTPIRGGSFCVAVSTGQPDAVKYLCTTLHGPYNFLEMCQEVGDMWLTHQHHAKVVVLDKDAKKKVKVLDDNTVDYIEAHYIDIMIEETLAAIPDDRVFTCEATVVEEPEATK
jgi:hypothetical protein